MVRLHELDHPIAPRDRQFLPRVRAGVRTDGTPTMMWFVSRRDLERRCAEIEPRDSRRVHHGGEISLTLGMHGFRGLDM